MWIVKDDSKPSIIWGPFRSIYEAQDFLDNTGVKGKPKPMVSPHEACWEASDPQHWHYEASKHKLQGAISEQNQQMCFSGLEPKAIID